MLWSPPIMTPLKYSRHFLSVIPTLKPHRLLELASGKPYWVLKKGHGFCRRLLRVPDPSPILTRHSDVPFLSLIPMVVQTLPLTTYPLFQSKRAGIWPWYNHVSCSQISPSCWGWVIILASFLLTESEGSPHGPALSCPQVCSASRGSLFSAVSFLLNQLRRDYTFLEDVSIVIGKFHPAFSIIFFFLFFICFWAELSASYVSTEELLLEKKKKKNEIRCWQDQFKWQSVWQTLYIVIC